jgi:hypothetical protein
MEMGEKSTRSSHNSAQTERDGTEKVALNLHTSVTLRDGKCSILKCLAEKKTAIETMEQKKS